MRRVIGYVFVVLAIASFTPIVGASSHFVSEAEGPPEDVEYVTTGTGDTGLIVTEDGISLERTADGVGLAPSGRYWFGDRRAPTEAFAFTFTHNVDGNPDLTVRFDGANVVENEVDNIKFSVFDERGKSIGYVSEDERALTFDGGPQGSTYYVVVLIDTHDTTPNDEIHGVFSVTL